MERHYYVYIMTNATRTLYIGVTTTCSVASTNINTIYCQGLPANITARASSTMKKPPIFTPPSRGKSI